MKFLHALAWVLVSSILQAQETSFPVLHVEEMPQGGVSLAEGWKFHAGDDTAWANPAFDDRAWATVNLRQYAKDILPAFLLNTNAWFRLRVYFDSSLRMQPLALAISQLGASEVYVDGNLLLSLGKWGPGQEFSANNPNGKPFLLQGNLSADTMFIAIRLATRPPYKPWMLASVMPLSVRILPWFKAVNDFQATLVAPRKAIGYSYMAIGMGLLFLLLYSLLPSEKMAIFFTGFCFMEAISTALISKMTEGNLDLNAYAWMDFANDYAGRCLGMLSLAIIALGATGRLSRFQVILIGYILLVDPILVIYWGDSPVQFVLNNLARIIFTIEIARLTVMGILKGKYIIALVGLVSTLLNTNQISHTFFHFRPMALLDSVNNYILFGIMTIYVAYNYARNSKSLLVQMEQNRKLAEEKQQILLGLKEKLEKEVADRTAALSQSLHELKETQAQLIQAEKMASLGELTAGIAHEIQNPLNFVNNFADLNMELMAEWQQELKSGNAEGAASVGEDIRLNLEKISHHGKRAEAIVKGMLLHSRTSGGQKEPTDINALADEYFRLSYHGLRAKDKLFNATMSQELDSSIGLLPMVAPDIGRVLLNLFNNAFYSVAEKKKKLGAGYEPRVSLRTEKKTDGIEISIRDNGMGIPEKMVDKIFNPFFTSKPAGLGTGLGLSISYDIITHEHGGRLLVETREGEFAEFRIVLPLPA